MFTQAPRDPWRAVWRVATDDRLLAILLLALAMGLTISVLFRQMPVDGPAAYARWLSETQARLGQATATLQTLGLFTVTRSLGFRALLALTAACLALRLVEMSSRLRHRWTWADFFPALAHVGALVLLAGRLVTRLWGWQVKDIVVLAGEQATLPNAPGWVALDQDSLKVSHGAGVVAFVGTYGPGVRAWASDNAGRSPSLQTAESDPTAELTAALTEDCYFAIPEAHLVVRLTPQPGRPLTAHSPVLIQVYRSPPGELALEDVMEGEASVTVDGVTVHLTSKPYARITATFNPGLWPTGAGVAFLAAGVLGGIALALHGPGWREITTSEET
jgi:hypothetical protein